MPVSEILSRPRASSRSCPRPDCGAELTVIEAGRFSLPFCPACEARKLEAASSPRSTSSALPAWHRAEVPIWYREARLTAAVDLYQHRMSMPSSALRRQTPGAWYAVTAEDVALIQALNAWVAQKPGTRAQAFVLAGTPGNGKTHLTASAILSSIELGRNGLWISEREIVRLHGAPYGSSDKTRGDELLSAALRVPLLAVDDLGCTRAADLVRDLIGIRYDRGLSMLVTSNRTKDELRPWLGPAAFGRLVEMAGEHWYWRTAPDLRIEQ